jgi:hypothetical protein
VENKYKITAEVDQKWFEILWEITKGKGGVTWLQVDGNAPIPNKWELSEQLDNTQQID